MVQIDEELWLSPCGTVRVQKVGSSWEVGKQKKGSKSFRAIERWSIGHNALVSAWDLVAA